MYLHFTNPFIHRLFPHFIWRVPTAEKVIFLTFDDGPIPEVTPWVIAELDKCDAKATFFCVGDNIRKHFSVFEEVIAKGHSVGNHTFNHLSGWKTPKKQYLGNIDKCEDYFAHLPKTKDSPRKLFRPPYGQISASQSSALKTDYRIVMWDVLSGDFDQRLNEHICLEKAIRYTQNGSIVVFHDSQKAKKNLYYALPRYLSHFSEQGFRFEKL